MNTTTIEETPSQTIARLLDDEIAKIEKEFPDADMVMIFAIAHLDAKKGRKDSGGNPSKEEIRRPEGRCVIRAGEFLSDRTAGSVAGAIHAASRDIRAAKSGRKIENIPTSGTFGKSQKPGK